jgi:hypothetical protein
MSLAGHVSSQPTDERVFVSQTLTEEANKQNEYRVLRAPCSPKGLWNPKCTYLN